MENSYGFLNGFLRNDTLHQTTLYSADSESITDINGKKYIDLNSGLWNVSLGYNNELNANILTAFSDIFEKNIPYVDMTAYSHDLYEKVSKKLLNFCNNDSFTKVIFTNSGSESIETAIKIVNSVTKKGKIGSFRNSYHGTFYGDMSISGLTKSINDNSRVDFTNTTMFDFPKTKLEEDNLLETIEKNSSNISALFIEPVIGSGGIFFREPEFYNKLLHLCQQKNIITVFDEVATGFYKTGNHLFIDKLEFTPDIICLSKALNNGTLPSGATIINDMLASKLKNTKIKHMSTQNGNLLTMSSINETLNYYKKYDEFLLDNVNQISKLTKKICLDSNIDSRIIGSMIAIPIQKKDVEPLIESLRLSGIIVYRHITNDQIGLTLFPNININIELYEKTLKYIIKKVKKYELS